MKTKIERNRIIIDLETRDIESLIRPVNYEHARQCPYCQQMATDWKKDYLFDAERNTYVIYECPHCGKKVI